MAIVHLSGTKLSPLRMKAPLNRRFMYAMGFTFIIAMHFFMRNPGGSGLTLSFNNATWISVSIAIAIGLYHTGRELSLRYTKLTIALFVSCILLTVPVLYSDSNPPAAITRIIGLWAGWWLFFVLQQFKLSNKDKQRLIGLIVIGALIEAIIGYIQLFCLKDGNLFGFELELSRPYGIFQQPNVMASFLATGFVLSGYMLARQQQKYGQKLSRTTLLYIMPLITLPLLIVIASRTGWIGAALGFICVVPYLYRFSTTKRLSGWVSFTAIGIGLGMMIGFSNVNDSGTSFIEQKTHLNSTREFFIPQAVDMFIEKPFTGYGYGRFEPEYILYTARQHQLTHSYHVGLPALDHPHNELLYWGVEGGILPLLGILIAALFVLIKLQSVRKGTRLAIFGLLIPIFIHSQLEYPFYHSAIHWISFVILLFWVDQRGAKYKIYNFSRFTRLNLRVLSLILPILTIFYMGSALHTNYVLQEYEKSRPKDPLILNKATNAIVWKDRLDWDIYTTYLNVGLKTQNTELIRPYIDWAQEAIRQLPRPSFYKNLILAYLGLGEESKAEQIRSEAEFLFPEIDFSDVTLEKVLKREAADVVASQVSKAIEN